MSTKILTGVLEQVRPGKPDGSTAYFLMQTDDTYFNIRFNTELQAEACKYNVPIALTVDDTPNLEGEYTVTDNHNFCKVLDYYG